ncbi:uncharacterized protein DS421_8g244970 [Arachis hypogaea]|nr:uncharacterized protein DS421_8g244970 [Arachis hypogaea]
MMASIDSTTEAPRAATEVETDPAAPALGEGAGDWTVPCAEAATAKRARRRRKVRDLDMVTCDDAIWK